mgnify:CR=1 FL=1
MTQVVEPVVQPADSVIAGLDAWRALPIKQQPEWGDPEAVAAASAELIDALALEAGQDVLELGFGTGTTLVRVAQAEDVNVTGIDMLPEMHKQAARRVANAGLAGRVTLTNGLMSSLPFADGSFDRVYCESVIAFQSNEILRATLREVRRVLRPGGLFIANEGIWKPDVDAATVRHGDLTTWYACVLSAGFDAIVNDRANRMTRPRGPSRYTLALARELATFTPREYVLTIDGEVRTQRAMLVSVANTPSLGGGMRIAPAAEVEDGLLDVFIVHPISRVGLVRVFPRVYSGTHVDHPAVELLRARSVRIEAADVVTYADGERLGPLPVEVTARPGALRVFT